MVRPILVLALAFVFAILMFFRSRSQSNEYRSVSPAEAAALMRADTTMVVLDVRTLEEFQSTTGHLPKARLIPVQELESRIGELSGLKDKTILVYCRSGHRSERASEILTKNGFKVVALEGGILRWLSDSLAVDK